MADRAVLAALAEHVAGAAARAANELRWVMRTCEDVRDGDVVRLPAAPDLEARVLFALPLDWHVRSGGHGHRGRFDDVACEHRRVSMRLDYLGVALDSEGRSALLELPAEMPVEIRMSAAELAVVELFGWQSRVKVVDDIKQGLIPSVHGEEDCSSDRHDA